MSPPPAQPLGNTPAACPACGYDLAGLPPLSRAHPCPECGHPRTIGAPPEEWLRHADGAWLARVSLGLRLSFFSHRYLVWLVAATLGLMVLVIVLETIAEVAGWPPPGSGSLSDVIGDLVLGAIAAGIGAHSVSCVLLTTRAALGGPPGGLARTLARWCGALFAPSCAAPFVMMIVFHDSPPWLWRAVAGVCLVNALAYLAAQPRWLRHLEWRTEAWTARSPERYRRAWMAPAVAGAIVLLLDWHWGWRSPGLDLGTRDPAESAFWALCTLVASVVIAERVGKPVSAAVKAELRAAAPTDA